MAHNAWGRDRLITEYEQLRKFAVSIVREKLLHGSNPTLLTLAAKLSIDELTPLLEGRHEELTSPLTEARAQVRQLKGELAASEQLVEATQTEREAAIVKLSEVTAERDTLRKWQIEIGEGTAYINWAEGQGGYEIAPASVIVDAWNGLASEHADGHIELQEQIDHLEGIAENHQRDVAKYRAAFIRDQAELASLRIDLVQAAKVTADLRAQLDAKERENETLRQMRAAEIEVERLKAEAPRQPFDVRCADALADEVAVLVKRQVIDSRSPAADALLEYRTPPRTDRSDRLVKLEGALERVARCLITPNPAITDTLWLDPSPRGPHITLYEFVCGKLGREVKAS